METIRVSHRSRYYLRERAFLLRICNELNSMRPCKSKKECRAFDDVIKKMKEKVMSPYHRFEVYHSRDIFIMCDMDEVSIYKTDYFNNDVEVALTDDIYEHPGIVFRLKK